MNLIDEMAVGQRPKAPNDSESGACLRPLEHCSCSVVSFFGGPSVDSQPVCMSFELILGGTLPGHDTFTCPNRIQWNKCQRKNLSLGFETKARAAVHVKNCKKKSACRDHPTSQAQHVSKLCFTSHVLHHLTKPLRKEKEHKSVRLYRH